MTAAKLSSVEFGFASPSASPFECSRRCATLSNERAPPPRDASRDARSMKRSCALDAWAIRISRTIALSSFDTIGGAEARGAEARGAVAAAASASSAPSPWVPSPRPPAANDALRTRAIQLPPASSVALPRLLRRLRPPGAAPNDETAARSAEDSEREMRASCWSDGSSSRTDSRRAASDDRRDRRAAQATWQ